MALLAISWHTADDGQERKHAMQSMNISLPEPLKQFVDGQIAQGRYSSVSEYVRELIRADEKRKAEEQLEAQLLEGLRSPESELTAADWHDIRKEALAQVKARSKRAR
jgi:antitoxin ParD1/3/4